MASALPSFRKGLLKRKALATRVSVQTSAIGVVILIQSMAGAVSAQSQAGTQTAQTAQTFSLPEASPAPAPTPEPQGPVDERAGVPIAPRIIAETRDTAPDTTPSSAANSTPNSAPIAATAERVDVLNGADDGADDGPQNPAQRDNPPTETRISPPFEQARTRDTAPQQSRPSAQRNRPKESGARSASPDFDAFRQELESAPARSRDGWYSVDEEPSGANPAANTPLSRPAKPSGPSLFDRLTSQPGTALSLFLMLVLLAAIIALRTLRSKRAAQEIHEEPSGALTAGVRASMGKDGANPLENAPDKGAGDEHASNARLKKEGASVPASSYPSSYPVSHKPPLKADEDQSPLVAKPVSLLDVHLALEISGAARSLMRLSVDLHLDILNRSDQALRDISIAGELACAQRGSAGPAPVDKTQPIASLERIAPGQSRRIGGTLHLPLAEISTISTISQGGRPVVIPLIHFRIGTLDQAAIKRSFVIGSPSPTSPTRVQPLLLDGPPGGLGPLRAQMIKHAASE